MADDFHNPWNVSVEDTAKCTSQKFKDLNAYALRFLSIRSTHGEASARHPAFDVLLNKLSPKAIVILDDANRTGERKLAEDFASALPKHSLDFLDHEKGTAIIRPK